MIRILILLLSLLLPLRMVFAEEELYSVNFRNVDLNLVIESVSRLSGKNFIIDPRVRGSVTLIAAEPVAADSLYEILLAVLHVYGYTAIEGENAVKILPSQVAANFAPVGDPADGDAAIITEIISLRYIDATQIVNVVRPLLSQQAQLIPLAENRKLLVIDTRANLSRLKKIVRSVDIVEGDDFDIISLQNTQAGDIRNLLQSIYINYKKLKTVDIQTDERTNRLIISGPAEIRRMIRALVAELDIEVQGAGNIRVIYLKYAAADKLVGLLAGVTGTETFSDVARLEDRNAVQESAAVSVPDNLPIQRNPITDLPQVTRNTRARTTTNATTQQSSQDTTTRRISSSSGVNIQADTDLNALIITGSGAEIATIETLVRQLDLPRAQVAIEVIIAEISDVISRELNVDSLVYGSGGGYIADLSGNIGSIAGDGVLSVDNLLNTAGNGALTGIGDAAVNGRWGWGFLVKALYTDSHTNILSTPYVVTLDNEEAEFVVGDNVPIVTGSYANDADSSNPFETIERKDVGITLNIKPQINGDNTIRLEIRQEVSNVQQNNIGAVDVVTTVRKINTAVNVRDGGLIALGGLIDDSQTEGARKIPFLGDIPIIGNLFRSQSSSVDKNTLMVFIRPRILRDDAAVASLSYAKYNWMRNAQLNKNTNLNAWLRLKEEPVLKKIDQPHMRFDFGESVDPNQINQTEKTTF